MAVMRLAVMKETRTTARISLVRIEVSWLSPPASSKAGNYPLEFTDLYFASSDGGNCDPVDIASSLDMGASVVAARSGRNSRDHYRYRARKAGGLDSQETNS